MSMFVAWLRNPDLTSPPISFQVWSATLSSLAGAPATRWHFVEQKESIWAERAFTVGYAVSDGCGYSRPAALSLRTSFRFIDACTPGGWLSRVWPPVCATVDLWQSAQWYAGGPERPSSESFSVAWPWPEPPDHVSPDGITTVGVCAGFPSDAEEPPVAWHCRHSVSLLSTEPDGYVANCVPGAFGVAHSKTPFGWDGVPVVRFSQWHLRHSL